MRLYEIEAKRAASNYAPIAERLMSDCSQYLAAIKYELYNNGLYRGFNGLPATPLMQKITPRPGRLPIDTPHDVHEAADEWFYMQFGIRYRSNAVFATGAQNNASAYGQLYSVFPVDGFKFCWSPKVMDMSIGLSQKLEQNGIRELDPKMPALVERYLDAAKYTDSNLIAAADRGHEVMIHCSSYYLIPITRQQPTILYDIMDALDNL